MATNQQNLIADSSTDANFRIWGSAISTQLAAMGLVQSSDTGQINWTTVTKPAATNTVQGYEIWKFNDALQATVPVFIKIEYGSCSNAAGGPGLWLTVGYATNGAGSITGTQVYARFPFHTSGSIVAAGANTYNCIFSGSTNRITAALWTNATSPTVAQQGCAFSVERSKDTAGADTSTGIIVGTWRAGNLAPGWQFVPFTGGVPTLENRTTAVLTNNTSFSFGTTTAMAMAIPIAGSPQNPGLNVLVYKNGDFVRDSTPTVSVYGSNHVYYCLSNVAFINQVGCDGSNLTNGALALRYE